MPHPNYYPVVHNPKREESRSPSVGSWASQTSAHSKSTFASDTPTWSSSSEPDPGDIRHPYAGEARLLAPILLRETRVTDPAAEDHSLDIKSHTSGRTGKVVNVLNYNERSDEKGPTPDYRSASAYYKKRSS